MCSNASWSVVASNTHHGERPCWLCMRTFARGRRSVPLVVQHHSRLPRLPARSTRLQAGTCSLMVLFHKRCRTSEILCLLKKMHVTTWLLLVCGEVRSAWEAVLFVMTSPFGCDWLAGWLVWCRITVGADCDARTAKSCSDADECVHHVLSELVGMMFDVVELSREDCTCEAPFVCVRACGCFFRSGDCQRRLLLPGTATASIIDFYISTIKVLRDLDPQNGVLLEVRVLACVCVCARVCAWCVKRGWLSVSVTLRHYAWVGLVVDVGGFGLAAASTSLTCRHCALHCSWTHRRGQRQRRRVCARRRPPPPTSTTTNERCTHMCIRRRFWSVPCLNALMRV